MPEKNYLISSFEPLTLSDSRELPEICRAKNIGEILIFVRPADRIPAGFRRRLLKKILPGLPVSVCRPGEKLPDGRYFIEAGFAEYFPENRPEVLARSEPARREICRRPVTFSELICPEMKSFFVLKIVFHGPESTGKTTLARRAAKDFGTVFCPEFSRFYLQKMLESRQLPGGNLSEFADISKIAFGQIALENYFLKRAKKILFCDTGLIVNELYSDYYFGKITEAMKKLDTDGRYDLHLLTDLSVPWTSDPMRDRPEDRENQLRLFEEILEQKNAGPRYKITGKTEEERYRQTRSYILAFLENF